jgi:hypothetical protein
MNDFYIGYLPKAPHILTGFLRRVVIALGLLALAVTMVLLLGQMPFAKTRFEYGKVRGFEGVIETTPYPVLLVERPGDVGQGEKYSRYLLVAPGKHGADELVAGLDGKHVRLRGQLIYRAGGTMIEIEPRPITFVQSTSADQDAMRDLGEVTVTGEIVDSKCYLGVMNPGQGKVHRDCATRCLSGGIPPLFVTADGQAQYMLVDLSGKAFGHGSLREFVAEPITARGELLQRGETRLLKIDPRGLTHH